MGNQNKKVIFKYDNLEVEKLVLGNSNKDALNKLLNNSYNVNVSIVNDGKEKVKWKGVIVSAICIVLLSIGLAFLFNQKMVNETTVNTFKDGWYLFLNVMKDFLYSSLFISLIALIIFVVFKRKV